MKVLLKIGFVALAVGAVGLIWAGAFGYMQWGEVISYAWKAVLILAGLGTISAALVMMTAKDGH